MKKKGFSIMEVVISVSLIGLIIATLGLSFLAVERLRLNAQIRAEIQRCGETILDYLLSLPPTDNYIHSTDRNITNDDRVLSLEDLRQSPNNRQQILDGSNKILREFLQNLGYEVVENMPLHSHSKKGTILTFSNLARSSNIKYSAVGNLYTLSVELYYISPTGRSNIIRVSRIVVR